MAEQTATKRKGRPEKDQTVPLIANSARSRVKREYVVEAQTAQLVDNYSGWAAPLLGINKDEAGALLFTRAIETFTRRDEMFQAHLKGKKGENTDE